MTLGATVQPVDREGNPSSSGKIVMISIGMSNTSCEFSEFIRLADADAHKNRNLVDDRCCSEWSGRNRHRSSRSVTIGYTSTASFNAARYPLHRFR